MVDDKNFLCLKVIQFDAEWQALEENLQTLKSDLLNSGYSGRGLDLIVLPEMALSGFTMTPAALNSDFLSMQSEKLQELSETIGAPLLIGLVENTERFVNSAQFFAPDRKQNDGYRKQKLFSPAKEQAIYQAGKQSCVFELPNMPHKAAVFICYDLRFPELFREVAKEVSVMFVLANWPESRQNHWRALLIARAIENQCFIVGVNRIGTDGNGWRFAGGSMVIDPKGDVILEMGQEHSAVIELDLQQVIEYRKQFPALDDM